MICLKNSTPLSPKKAVNNMGDVLGIAAFCRNETRTAQQIIKTHRKRKKTNKREPD